MCNNGTITQRVRKRGSKGCYFDLPVRFLWKFIEMKEHTNISHYVTGYT